MNFILVVAVFAVLAALVLPVAVMVAYCVWDRPARTKETRGRGQV